jgi:hypothetical protein
MKNTSARRLRSGELTAIGVLSHAGFEERLAARGLFIPPPDPPASRSTTGTLPFATAGLVAIVTHLQTNKGEDWRMPLKVVDPLGNEALRTMEMS